MALTKVTAGVIAANAVNDSFGSQSITGDKIGLTAINANNIVDGTITVGKLAAGTLDSANSAAVYANGAFGAANTAATNITVLQGVNTTQNTNITTADAKATSAGVYANGAFAAANTKQATLVSGTNIKTINNTSLLGNGDITVGASTDLSAIGTYAYFTMLADTGSFTAGGTYSIGTNQAQLQARRFLDSDGTSAFSGATDNTGFSGTWRVMNPGGSFGGTTNNRWFILAVRVS